jgi:adenosine deaminase
VSVVTLPPHEGGDGRDLRALPKAHLHLHFTGALRHATMLELADRHRVRLPDVLRDHYPPPLSAADERGWFRFQRLYDTARSVLQQPDDLYRLLHEVAEDEAADGSRWLEIQVDPSGYAARFDGLTATLRLVLDAAATASQVTGVGIGVIVGANRTRHPMDARTLARLAAGHAHHGVVGFGLANDERRGRAADFARAFRIARDAGLPGNPHAGELRGPSSVAETLDHLLPRRIGHGVRSVEDPAVVRTLAAEQVTLEVCPSSNVALGVFRDLADVPVRTLFDAGVPVALGADDPLLFGSRLATQYEIARAVHGFSDAELGELARMSVRGSFAPLEVKAALLRDVDAWLAVPPPQRGPTAGPTAGSHR